MSNRKPFFGKKMTLRQSVTLSAGGIALVAVTVAALANQPAASSATQNEQDASAPLPVETSILEPQSHFERLRTFTGVIKAARASELGFERIGRISRIDVVEGQQVEAGERIAQLDTANLLARQQELRAQQEAAASKLEEMISGPRKQTIAAAEAEVRDLSAQVDLANLNLARRKKLLESKALSQEEFDQTRLGLESLVAKRDAAAYRLDEFREGTRGEQIAAQRAAVRQLDAALKNIAVELEESRLVAPFAGRIAARHLDEGAIVAPGEPLVRLLEIDRLEAWIGLPTTVIDALEPGTSSDLLVGDETLSSTLRALLPELDSTTRTRTAIFDLPSDTSAAPAQIVRVQLKDAIEARGYWVPTQALSRGARGLWSLLIAEEDANKASFVAVNRPVEVLYTDGARAFVRGTIQPSEQVISGGTHRVTAGQRVAIESKLHDR